MFGRLEQISMETWTVDIKKRKDTADLHCPAVFGHKSVDSRVIAKALLRLGEYVAEKGIEGKGPFQAGRDLLLRETPRIGGVKIKDPTETTLEAAMRVAPQLSGGGFPIQGPPGAGKTYTAARMICKLVESGKKVAVTANSHKVIRNILDGVIEASTELGITLQCMEMVRLKETDQACLKFTTKNETALAAIGTTAQVVGGTKWLWSRLDAYECADVLFIDEAAQMCLADVLAVSQAAKTIVLIGDPRQLDQPIQGSHPEGTDISALQHMLGTDATIPEDRGLFLEETWRLHPDICVFTSEMFYQNRLHSLPGLENQTVKSKGRVQGSGLRYVSVCHEGNQSSSPEEADKIKELVDGILDSGATWVDRNGHEQPIELTDILIIAPYNAQVFELQQRIPNCRIGTVDKFQGQQAPIVIYSMTTSSYADAPRGMEFLYSANRFNVATSRAKCLCVLVGSPAVFEAECRTPRQMQLANAFCRYLELAQKVS
jgi:uncharacterized protein